MFFKKKFVLNYDLSSNIFFSAAVSSGIAIGQLASILHDSREILRNETVLLFCELCENNKDLPVLFAFESGFELLISIMDSEGRYTMFIDNFSLSFAMKIA
jgi:hypothetical protein